MKFGLKRIVKSAIAVIISALVLIPVAGCKKEPARIEEKPATSVIVTYPAPKIIQRTVRFSGSLKGSREVMVHPTLPGKLIGYTRSEGSYVSKGATVATIDRDIPGVEYEPVPVEAPISGRFFSMGLSPGEMVAPQMPIGRISETSRLKLAFNVPEKYINSVKQGSKADLYVPTIDYSATATLSRVSRFVDSRSGAAQAEATLSNPSGKLTPGMHAEINVVVASKKADLALPVDCVLGLDGKFCYVLAEDSTAVKRDVGVGLDDGEYIEILSGLAIDDAVLYVGQRVAEEGGRVSVKDTYTPAEESND